VVIQRRVGEPGDRLGNALTGGLDGDIVVLLEVDTCLLLGGVVGYTEELALKTRVGGSWDVLAVFPLTIARASRGATATTTTWLAVCGGVELAGRATAPATAAALGTIASARSKGLSIGPVTATAVHGRRTVEATTWRGTAWGGAPCTATDTRTTAVHHRRRATVHGGSTAWAAAEVRRNIRRTLAVEAVRCVLGVVQVETTHVELFSHIVGIDVRRRLRRLRREL
jgi:hypothetical protein